MCGASAQTRELLKLDLSWLVRPRGIGRVVTTQDLRARAWSKMQENVRLGPGKGSGSYSNPGRSQAVVV